MNTKTVYRFDKDGYSLGECLAQVDKSGNVMLPPDCTELEPTITEGYFARFVDGAWTNEKIPTTCAEAIELNYSCISNGPEPHNQAVKAIMEALVEAEKDAYKTVVSDDFIMTIEAIPEKTLEEVRAEKLAELSSVAGQFDQYKCDEMYVQSSLGWKANADIRSQTNMQGLIDVLGDEETTMYKDFDNQFHKVNKTQLATLKGECIKNGQSLYQQKWTYQVQINNASTIEEINAIEINFTMMDFS